MRELLKQARDALTGLTSARGLFCEPDETLAHWKAAWDAEAAINAELAKPEEKTVPLAMLKECGPDWHGIYLSDKALGKVAAKYGYKVVPHD